MICKSIVSPSSFSQLAEDGQRERRQNQQNYSETDQNRPVSRGRLENGPPVVVGEVEREQHHIIHYILGLFNLRNAYLHYRNTFPILQNEEIEPSVVNH